MASSWLICSRANLQDAGHKGHPGSQVMRTSGPVRVLSLLCQAPALEGSRIGTLGTSVMGSGPSEVHLNSCAHSKKWGGPGGQSREVGQGSQQDDNCKLPCFVGITT